MTSDNQEKKEKKYPMARTDWSSLELQRLRLLLPYQYTRAEFVSFFGRPPANIIKMVKEMQDAIKDWPVVTNLEIMTRPPLPEYGNYDWRAPLDKLFPTLIKPVVQAIAAEETVAHVANGPVSAAAADSVADENEPKEKCEGCGADPVVGHDSEGVPLCQGCIDELKRQDAAAQQKPKKAK